MKKQFVVSLNVAVSTEEGIGLAVAPVTGIITGLLLPDGSIARPVLAFEIEPPGTPEGQEPDYRDVSSHDELEELGLDAWDYISTSVKFDDRETGK